MKNKINLLIIGIFLLTTISANLVITPNNPEITININQAKNFTATIFNNYTFDIYDLSFPELKIKGFTFPQIDIPKNTSKTFTYQVKTTESFYGQINSKVQFNFLVDLPEEITTYYVQITENGFNPTYKTIRKGDSIQWNNLDDTTHDIYSTEFNTISIEPNQSELFTFNNLGTFNYYDLDFSIFNEFNGQIEVINRTSQQKAHNPNNDGNWLVQLNSVSQPTTIEISNSKNEYEINYANTKKGLITITNTGSNTAEKIKLTSNSTWVVFDKNNFDIAPGDPEGVGYSITPYLTNTTQTNKTYSISIGIKAYNTEQENLTISVFVPYREITGNLDSDFEVAMWYQNVFCPSHPCSLFCSPELPECVNAMNGTGGSDTLTANITTYDLFNSLKDLSAIKKALDRLENLYKQFEDKYGISIEEAVNLGNQSLELQLDNNKKNKSNSTTIWFIILGVAIIGSLIYFLRRWNKRSESNNFLETKSYKE